MRIPDLGLHTGTRLKMWKFMMVLQTLDFPLLKHVKIYKVFLLEMR